MNSRLLAGIIIGFTLSACSASKKSAQSDQDPNLPPPSDDVAQTDSVPPPPSDSPAGSEAPPQTASLESEPPSLGAEPQTEPKTEPKVEAKAEPVAPVASPDASLDAPAEAPVAQESKPEVKMPEESPQTPVSFSGDSTTYTMNGDDTLMKVAFETYGDLYQWKKIYEDNKDKIADPNNVPRGTVLKLAKAEAPITIERNGEKYLIKRGDTLGTISNEVYGTQKKWKKLWENNRQLIHDPNKIYAGFFLYYVVSPEDKQEMEHIPDSMAGGETKRNPGSVKQAGAGIGTGPGGVQAAPSIPPTQTSQAPNGFPTFKK